MVGPINIEVSIRKIAAFEEKKSRKKPTIPLQLEENSRFRRVVDRKHQFGKVAWTLELFISHSSIKHRINYAIAPAR
jgi:hypothetical protein